MGSAFDGAEPRSWRVEESFMELKEVLATLGYEGSRNFLSGDRLPSDPDNAHIYRKAQHECGLSGVYTLRGSEFGEAQADVPVVYLCTAESEHQAADIHRRVWNQNIVPFLIVVSPRSVRLYSGFRFAQPVQQDFDDQQTGILRIMHDFNEVASSLSAFRAEAIDTGDLWKEWGPAVTPETRVDWELLGNLEKLDDWLVEDGIDDRSLSHAIIGKFVYLRYLRDRQILSDRKLQEWGVEANEVFSREAKLESFKIVVDGLDDWLNGSVFPIADWKLRQLGVQRLRQVAAIFQGDTLYGQLHLDFKKYDFSFIPIETLSVIYQQFLHASEQKSGKSKGRQRGAYYTPVPLVNFILDQLETRRPFRSDMRVIDASCGSGVFLVQCYRRLIEQQARENTNSAPKPVELRDLLINHIFGIDTDTDACQIAELSLILTLLDYIKPPDLTQTRFKLPVLRGKNIFHGNAFDDVEEWDAKLFKQGFDWVVGNPPWTELNPQQLDPLDRPVLEWIQANKDERPTGGNQAAEAFAWRACDLTSPRGVVGLLIPAMTLFKYESKPFRESFFEKTDVWSVANFSNLAEVLFAGRSRVPAAALFYSYRHDEVGQPRPETVEIYSPLVANQVVHDPGRSGRRLDIWNIVVNASEIRKIRYRELASGDALPWKIATWASPFDDRLLSLVRRRWPTLEDLENEGDLIISQGLELRAKKNKSTTEKLDFHPELNGKTILDVDHLKKRRYLFRFPEAALVKVPPDKTYVRKGRYALPFSICKPPHVIVGAARTFAIFEEEFLIVPARQIGMASSSANAPFLRALALYLNSDFVRYHQFLTSPQHGVQRAVATLHALRSLPVPFGGIVSSLAPWEDLYRKTQKLSDEGISMDAIDKGEIPPEFSAVLQELNDLTNEALKLDPRQRAAVHDLVHVRLALIDGKVGLPATRAPRKDELETYAGALQAELDGFLGNDVAARHRIEILCDQHSGMIEIEPVRNTMKSQTISIFEVGADTAGQFERTRNLLLQKRSQWVYFDRNLRIYDGLKTYLFKPMRRMHWTESQAMTDASEVIAETLQQGSASLERVVG
jgi:hypothetical protein